MNFDISYNLSKKTELCFLFEKYGSDKSVWHNYSKFYYELFKNIRYNKNRIFELGIGSNNINIPSNMGEEGKPGASLRAWKEFFPNSLIFGADIDKNILFKEERINTFFCNQKSKKLIKNLWNNSELIEKFDIIIDDGLHDYFSNILFFMNSIHKLKKGGIYIIEDIKLKYKYNIEKNINKWRKKYVNLDIKFLMLKNKKNIIDNNLLIFKKKN